MPILVTKGNKLPALWRNIRPIERHEFDKLVEGETDYELADKLHLFVEEVRKALQGISEDVDKLNIKIVKGRPVAYQFFEITASDLEDSDDPEDNTVSRSVLITKSANEYEFNWLMAGGVRDYKVVLGPGRGVASHHVIIDQNDANAAMIKWKAVERSAFGGEVTAPDSYAGTEDVVCRPYGMTGLRLQFGKYKPDGNTLKFWPSSLHIGTWAYLEQSLPQVEIR